jgi:hypothetical protein
LGQETGHDGPSLVNHRSTVRPFILSITGGQRRCPRWNSTGNLSPPGCQVYPGTVLAVQGVSSDFGKPAVRLIYSSGSTSMIVAWWLLPSQISGRHCHAIGCGFL